MLSRVYISPHHKGNFDMKTSRALLTSLVFAALASPVSAETDGNIYLGVGVNALALDGDRIFDVPTSSPGHAPKTFNGILGYQFNEMWATDLTFGQDVSGDVSTDQFSLNGYRFFGSNNWKPFVSAGLSSLGVDEAIDDRTQQIQAGLGVSGMFTDSLEFRANYQFYTALSSDSEFDRSFGLSLNWHIGGKKTAMVAAVPKPTPEPEPESVPMEEEVVDTYELLVEFDFDKAEIRTAYESEFKEIAQILSDNPGITMTIEGHTDWIGSEDYNVGLSELRADAVKNKFVNEYAIAADRIDTVAYGESRPIADNNTEDGRQRNRRAIAITLESR